MHSLSPLNSYADRRLVQLCQGFGFFDKLRRIIERLHDDLLEFLSGQRIQTQLQGLDLRQEVRDLGASP